jgi:hypothetical protein
MIKINSYSHLPLADQLSIIKLLIFLEGQCCLRQFEQKIKEIVNA